MGAASGNGAGGRVADAGEVLGNRYEQGHHLGSVAGKLQYVGVAAGERHAEQGQVPLWRLQDWGRKPGGPGRVVERETAASFGRTKALNEVARAQRVVQRAS